MPKTTHTLAQRTSGPHGAGTEDKIAPAAKATRKIEAADGEKARTDGQHGAAAKATREI